MFTDEISVTEMRVEEDLEVLENRPGFMMTRKLNFIKVAAQLFS